MHIQGRAIRLWILYFNSEKEELLATIITKGIIDNSRGHCTSVAKYEIETELFNCSFQDNSCELSELLSLLHEK